MRNFSKGISLIELLMVIAIAGILISVSISVFSSLSNSQSLDRDVANVLSYIEKARAEAINSEDGVEHGVQFASSTIKVFSGTNFLSANVESTYNIPFASQISVINLSNSTTTLYFAKLTGNASATGSITISRISGGASKTIVIYATGITEIQ